MRPIQMSRVQVPSISPFRLPVPTLMRSASGHTSQLPRYWGRSRPLGTWWTPFTAFHDRRMQVRLKTAGNGLIATSLLHKSVARDLANRCSANSPVSYFQFPSPHRYLDRQRETADYFQDTIWEQYPQFDPFWHMFWDARRRCDMWTSVGARVRSRGRWM